MRIAAAAGEVRLDHIEFDGILSLEQVLLSASDVELVEDGGLSLRVPDLRVTVVLAELPLNKFLSTQSLGAVRDLRVTFLNGRVRIAGRYFLGRVPIPFTLTAAPEIEGGCRLRLDSQQITVLAAAVPGIGRQGLESRINKELAERLDVSKLPVPARLADVRVEPGRLTLTAVVSIRLAPRQEPAQGANLRTVY